MNNKINDKGVVIVTGAAGFIGSSLTDALLAIGYTVIGIDNFNDSLYPPNIKQANITSALSNKNFILIKYDLSKNIDKLISQISHYKISCIFHLAALAGVRGSMENPELYLVNNVTSTKNVLTCATKLSIPKIIFASSSSVYGSNPMMPWRETSKMIPLSPYAVSKIRCEELGQKWSESGNHYFISLRLFTVYGPRQRPDLAIYKFINAILNDDKIIIYGDGSALRDFTYVGDIVNAFINSSVTTFVKNFETLNIGNSNPITVGMLINKIEKVSGNIAHIIHRDKIPGDAPNTWATIEKAKKLIHFNPAGNLDEHLVEQVKWQKTLSILDSKRG